MTWQTFTSFWLQFWQLRTSIQTIFVTWQLRVTLDSICNSCDVYEDGHWSIITKPLSLFLSLCILGINSVFTGFHFSDIHSNFQKLNWHYWCDHGMWWWSDKIKDGGSLVLRIKDPKSWGFRILNPQDMRILLVNHKKAAQKAKRFGS